MAVAHVPVLHLQWGGGGGGWGDIPMNKLNLTSQKGLEPT